MSFKREDHPGAALLGKRVTVVEAGHPWQGYSGTVTNLTRFFTGEWMVEVDLDNGLSCGAGWKAVSDLAKRERKE